VKKPRNQEGVFVTPYFAGTIDIKANVKL